MPVRLYALHKPRGVICSSVAEGGAPTVFDLLPEGYRDWFAVGRLDKDSEGLILFCNKTRIAQRLMDPGGAAKTYAVTVQGFPREDKLEPMRIGGLSIEGKPVGGVQVRRLGKAPRGGTRFEVVLHEGRNRQIRRLFAAAGFRVRKLVRAAIGTLELGDLLPGEGRELSNSEVEALLGTFGRSVRP